MINSRTILAVFLLAALPCGLSSPASGKGPSSFPANATFTTISLFPWQTEGLTGDNEGNFYTAARNVVDGANAPQPCPVWRVNIDDSTPVVVGYVPLPATGPCVTSGLALNHSGDLFIVANGLIYRLTPDENTTPTATLYVASVPGANGVAFDKADNLWISQGFVNIPNGQKGEGRIWMVPAGTAGPTNPIEQFRVQPMRTDQTFTVGTTQYDGVGRQIRSFPPGNLTNPTASPGDVIVANGIAFDHGGDLLIADTARAAIWRVKLDNNGNLLSETNCDKAFTANTLCLSNVWVAHPLLEATDGIALDMAGNVWGTANGRQAIVVVTNDGSVQDIFRNPLNASGFRNQADPAYGNDHILEYPSSPYLMGKRFCTVSFDANTPGSRDNFPNSAGEISPTGPNRGKLSCMDQDLMIPGLPLPI